MTTLNAVHRPGRHCASTALADLANYHGVGFTEAMCFGIGAGLGIWYLNFKGLPASRMIHVRSADIEAQFFTRMGHDFSWQQYGDPAESQTALKACLDNGRPAVIQTDIYHLPYYGTDTHFPGHLIAVWGYDDQREIFLVTDTERPGFLEVPFENMKAARFYRDGMFDIRGNLYAPGQMSTPRNLTKVIRDAVISNSRMLAQSTVDIMGIRGLETMCHELPQWNALDDWRWTARFAYQVIEKRGTGGGGFRWMYADFLTEAAEYVPEIQSLGLAEMMHDTAAAWRDLAMALKAVSEREKPDFNGAAATLRGVIQSESAYHEAVLGGLMPQDRNRSPG